MKLKDLLGRVDKRKSEVLNRAKFAEKNKAREVVGKTALDTIEKRVFPSLERVLRFPSNLWSWLTSAPAYAPEVAPAPEPELIATALITFSEVPDGGVWNLSYNSEDSLFINFNDDAEAVQLAVRSIEALEAATVTGDYAQGFTVVLGENEDVSNLEVSSSNLEADSTPVDITITDITE